MSPLLAPALDRFHESLRQATTRNRFFNVHPHLSQAELERSPRSTTTTARRWGARHRRRDRRPRALRAAGPGSTTVEAAFVVADRWQHHGVGGALFALLSSRARELGVTRFVADTLAGNQAMRAVFRHAGLAHRESCDRDVARVTIDLAPT
jgi:GNAT superfamily N-acetyltransferase